MRAQVRGRAQQQQQQQQQEQQQQQASERSPRTPPAEKPEPRFGRLKRKRAEMEEEHRRAQVQALPGLFDAVRHVFTSEMRTAYPLEAFVDVLRAGQPSQAATRQEFKERLLLLARTLPEWCEVQRLESGVEFFAARSRKANHVEARARLLANASASNKLQKAY